MVRNRQSIESRVREAVKVAVSKERGFPVSELESTEDLMDDSRIGPDGFYRIIADVEQALGIGTFEGNWEFEEGTFNGIVSYYVGILRRRRLT